jgi:hypothetical protein
MLKSFRPSGPSDSRQSTATHKKSVTVLLSFGIALTLWFFLALGKIYQDNVTFPVRYVNIPEGAQITNAALPKKISMLARGSGFNLFLTRFYVRRDTISINVAASSESGVFLTNRESSLFSEEMSFPVEPVHVSPDTINFGLKRKLRRKIPVKNMTSYEPSGNFRLEGKMKVQPESIEVYGPSEIVNKLNSWPTVRYLVTEKTSNFSESVALDTSSLVTFSREDVTISGNIIEYTEFRFETKAKIINIPANRKIKVPDTRVTIIADVAMKDYEKIKESDFEVICDFSKVKAGQSYVRPEILKKSSLVVKTQVEPPKLPFVLVRQR